MPPAGRKRGREPTFTFGEAELDLVPMIDCIFLLLLFFMLCGRITMEQRTTQITVPPTKTAARMDLPHGWTRVVINVFGTTSLGRPPRNSIRLGETTWDAQGSGNLTAFAGLRQALDQVYDHAEKFDDPKGSGVRLPKVVAEVRADRDTEYRVVQEIQQVLSDAIDPRDGMRPRANANRMTLRPFINVEFTARRPGER